MAVQPTFMLIADIGGYTRFMKMHRTSLAHAHDIIARLLETVIDSAPGLTLAKLEGDAAFFYRTVPRHAPGIGRDASALPDVPGAIARMYRAFHQRLEQMKAANHCACDACQQIGNLKIKFAGHLGEAALHRVKRMTELAGVDVILVHRMLKNSVPVPEYLLMTESVLAWLNEDLRRHASPYSLTVEELGPVNAYFVDVQQMAGSIPSQPTRAWPIRLIVALGLVGRTLPYMIGLRKPCAGYRNLESDHVHS